MITSGIIYFFFGVLWILLKIIPGGPPLPEALSNSISQIWMQAQAWSGLFPINTLLTTALIAMGFEIAILTLKVMLFIAKFTRGK